jgi:hypothetical protein
MSSPGDQASYQPWREERVPRPSDPDWDERASGYPPAAYLPAPQSPTPEQFAPPVYTPPPPAQYVLPPGTVPYGFPKPRIGLARVVRRVTLAVVVFGVLIAVGLAYRGNRLPFLNDMVDTLLGRDTIQSSDELEAGMCLKEPIGRVVVSDGLVLVKCAEPHGTEVVGTFQLPKGEYPGEATLVLKATEKCPAKTRAYVPDYEDLGLQTGLLGPTVPQWEQGNRTIACVVVDRTGKRTGSVKS